jgi:hypothetical protein
VLIRFQPVVEFISHFSFFDSEFLKAAADLADWVARSSRVLAKPSRVRELFFVRATPNLENLRNQKIEFEE